MTLPAGTDVIVFQGTIYLTICGGVQAEATQYLAPWGARAIGHALIKAADDVEGKLHGGELNHPKTSPHE